MKAALNALVIVCLAGIAVSPTAAQSEQLWLEQFGTNNYEQGNALASDGGVGAFVAGYTWGSLGGPNAGREDVYLARYDGLGEPAWVIQFGTKEYEGIPVLLPDDSGGVFIAGSTGGSLGRPNEGSNEVFLARYSGAGDRNWIVQFGTDSESIAQALCSDGADGVFLGGYTWGDLNGPNAGHKDAFLARHDDTGTQLWIVQFGTEPTDVVAGLGSDGEGGAFVAGYSNGDLAGPNGGGGKADAFVARFDASGNRRWIKQFGTPLSDYSTALIPDGAGGFFMAGYTTGSLGGPNAGASDGFLARYDGDGSHLWTTQFGTELDDTADALAPDEGDGVFIAGSTFGSLGAPNSGEMDAFMSRYNSAGDCEELYQFGTAADDAARALAPVPAGGLIIAGDTEGALGSPNLGGSDAFIARYGTSCPADCDGNGALELFDFLCFVNQFNAGAPTADCDGDGALTLFDFLCFTNAFNGGC